MENFIHQVFIELVKLSDSFDLANNVLLSQELEQPVVALFLDNLNLPNVLHIWVHSDPKHGIVVLFLTEDVLCL